MAKRNTERVGKNARLDSLIRAREEFSSVKRASEVLTRVKAVPTCFLQFDHATRVGGFPVERFSLVHGPSNHGKSLFTLGLVKSFLQRDHLALYIDAERTTPFDWVQKLLGPELAAHPGFYAERPESYEQTIANVRSFLMTIARLREDGKLDQDTAAIVVVDSIRKLVPKSLMDEVVAAAKKDAKGGDVTAGRDRSAQIKAKMNAAWVDEITPMLEKANAGFLVVGREMEDPDADKWARKFGNNYKLGGGSALFFEASLVARVERAGWVTKGASDDDKKVVYGERHRVTIRKTKVAGKDGKQTQCYFHSSNGVFLPEGFDHARDVLDMAERFGVVEKKGSWLLHAGDRIGNGQHAAVKHLHGMPNQCAEIERQLRAAFEAKPPTEFTEDGEIL